MSRNYHLPDEAEAERRRAEYIHTRRSVPRVTGRNDHDGCCGSGDSHGSSWGSGFQPRERVEAVRNCAALPRDVVDGVVLRVASCLLGMTEDAGATGDWNRGGKPSMPTTLNGSCHTSGSTLIYRCKISSSLFLLNLVSSLTFCSIFLTNIYLQYFNLMLKF